MGTCNGDALGVQWGRKEECSGDALGACNGDALGMHWGCYGGCKVEAPGRARDPSGTGR